MTNNNHLGPASWITDETGHPVQYIHYAPYGELLANQRATSYDERYKFIGKERDEESGYDNFGARYYIPPLGIWTRPDPLLNKYIDVSPYMYCEGNPIKYVDPDGREKHNKMDPNSGDSQRYLYDGANSMPEPGDGTSHIIFYSHGSSDAMYPFDREKPMSAEDFVAYLSENSDLWKNTEDKSSLTVVLISCKTGTGENPIAKRISELIPEATIIAPTKDVKTVSDGIVTTILGVADSEAITKEEILGPECSGQWNTYKNGELINTSNDGGLYNLY